jgi:type IV pilus assembly protein PilW
VEIMIASLIGVFLLGGLLQIFINSKQTNRVQDGLSRLQENGRFAMEFLGNDIRMAGFLGCNSQATLTNTVTTPTDFLYSFSKAIEGFESTSASAWTPAMNAAIPSPLGGSDVITIRRTVDQGYTVTAHAVATASLTLDATATTANLKTSGFLTSAGANNCTVAVVTDCSAAAVFQVSAITGSALAHAAGGSCTLKNATDDLGKTYVDAQVYPINTLSYYVATNDEGRPSLYRRIGGNNAEELVQGIEKMQILYGVDTDPTPDNSPNYYVSANSVADMTKVVSVRVTLLVVTLDGNLSKQPLPYTYNGATVTPADRNIRRVFSTTIAVRNRLS